MNAITIRFYAQLNDFLPAARRQLAFSCSFEGQPSVKDLIESLGIPHPEVDLIIINGKSADFSTRLQGGENVSVYPSFRSIEIDEITRVRPQPLCTAKFALDGHLGKLASYLRMLGFDSFYSNEIDDASLADLAAVENRIVLTCDRGLLKRKKVIYGHCIRDKYPRQQLSEVLDHYQLGPQIQPFKRCIHCNTVLDQVAKTDIMSSIPPRVRDYCKDFRLCPGCGRIYWSGTHYQRMVSFIEQITEELEKK